MTCLYSLLRFFQRGKIMVTLIPYFKCNLNIRHNLGVRLPRHQRLSNSVSDTFWQRWCKASQAPVSATHPMTNLPSSIDMFHPVIADLNQMLIPLIRHALKTCQTASLPRRNLLRSPPRLTIWQEPPLYPLQGDLRQGAILRAKRAFVADFPQHGSSFARLHRSRFYEGFVDSSNCSRSVPQLVQSRCLFRGAVEIVYSSRPVGEACTLENARKRWQPACNTLASTLRGSLLFL